ncbi:tRNA-dihydrouridine synthase 2 [Coemansia sp. RSA 2703]|nr:tRNA-dihydrouridine synthase 2 [Coemansia sp. RSA 2703]
MSIPVTCKIRVFDDVEQTLELVRRIAGTGISALTVHCRTRAMRPSEKAMWHRLNDIVKELPDLPIVLNGDIFEYKDVQRARDDTGATSVMTARGAAANPSIFRSAGLVSPMDTAVELTKLAIQTSNVFLNTKYILLQMHPETKSKSFEILNKSRRYNEMCEAMGLSDYYESEGAQFINERCEPGKNKQKSAGAQSNTQADSSADSAADTTALSEKTTVSEQTCAAADTPAAKRIKT